MGLFYTATNWLARLGTGLNKFLLTHADSTTETVSLTNTPDTVTQQGTQITATRLNNMEGFLSALDDKVLTQNVTLYVDRTNGSDANSGTSSGSAKLTLQGALNILPPNLGGYNITINVANSTAATLDQYPAFYGFNGGAIPISGDYYARSIDITNCTRVVFANGLYLQPQSVATTENALVVVNSTVTCLGACSVVGLFNNHAIHVEAGGNMTVAGTCTTQQTGSSTGHTGVYCTTEGRFWANTITQSSLEYGLYAIRGGRIYYNSKSQTVTTGEFTGSGGRIYTGAQRDFGAEIDAIDITLQDHDDRLFYLDYCTLALSPSLYPDGEYNIYVNTDTGSNSNTGMSSAQAKKSLQGALDIVPKNLAGWTVIIHLTGMTKDVAATMANYNGGVIRLVGSYYETRSITIDNCSRVLIEVTQLLITPASATDTLHALQINNASNVMALSTATIVISGSFGETGVRVIAGSTFTCLSTDGQGSGLLIQPGAKSGRTGVRVLSNSRMYAAEMTVEGAQYGIVSYQGSTLGYSSYTASNVTSQNVTNSGGRIYSGTQSSIPSY